jgi:uncharacterized protein
MMTVMVHAKVVGPVVLAHAKAAVPAIVFIIAAAIVPEHAELIVLDAQAAMVHAQVVPEVVRVVQDLVWEPVLDIVTGGVDSLKMGIERSSKTEFGKTYESWESGVAKTITFIVTEDCQLRCRYCYITGKNTTNKMSFETAQKTIDYILCDTENFPEKSVIFEFIGGEPFLEIELIDKICDYVKLKMYELDHFWFSSYRFSISTNGLNYHSKPVQEFITKNHNHLSIGISLDGIRKKHDSQRIYPNGRGSYDDVLANIPLWMEQFPDSGTKATVGHDDLAYIKDSVIHLWKIGIRNVNINLVYEDCWQEGDDVIYENQLKELADEILANQYYQKYYCSFFIDSIGKPMDSQTENQNWCGAGKMLAVDHSGNFYPCVRFVSYSLSKKPPRFVGNLNSGINKNLLRPFLSLNRTVQSSEECNDCEVASGCAWCQGLNYDEADTETIYQRATFICKMHKARVRANNYFWEKFNAQSK